MEVKVGVVKVGAVEAGAVKADPGSCYQGLGRRL